MTTTFSPPSQSFPLPYSMSDSMPASNSNSPCGSSQTTFQQQPRMTVLTRRRNQCRSFMDSLHRSSALMQKALALLLCCVMLTMAAKNTEAATSSSTNSSTSSSSSSHSSRRRTADASSRTSPPSASPNPPHSSSSSSNSSSSRLPPIGTGSLDSSRLHPHSVSYYETLLVSSAASPADIKQSHRRLAIRYHPDKYAVVANQGNGAATMATSAAATSAAASGSFKSVAHTGLSKLQAQNMFIAIQEAYECLSNPMERRRYDYSLRTRTRYKKLAGPPNATDEAEPASPYAYGGAAATTNTGYSSTYSTANSTAQSTAYSTAQSTRRNSSQADHEAAAFASAAARSSRRNSISLLALLLLPLALFNVLVLKPMRLRISARLPSLPSFPSFSLPSPLSLLRRLTKLLALTVYASIFIPINCFVLANAARRTMSNFMRRMWGTSDDASTNNNNNNHVHSGLHTRRPQPYAATPTASTFSAASSSFSPSYSAPSYSSSSSSSSSSSGIATTSCGSSENSTPSLSTCPSVACMASVEDTAAAMAAASHTTASKSIHSLSDAEEWEGEEGEGDTTTSHEQSAHRMHTKTASMRVSASMPNFAGQLGEW